MIRRKFIAAGTALAAIPTLAAEADVTRKVAVIGHTDRGNFGHGLDTIWLQIPETEIVGVADANSAGLADALAKLKPADPLSFTDYREMLAKTKPEFVSVATRHPDQHLDMILAAIKAGARGIYVEKPFCRTPAEADQIIAAADKAGTKIAVAHRNRYHPTLAAIDQIIADGTIGKLLEIRGRGKGDRRGGGEDLWVLGSHVLNLIEYFGGAPETCSANLYANGKLVTAADVVEGNEALGPLAGNELHARYRLNKGITATFDSIADDDTGGHGFGLQLIGSKGIINIRCDRDPLAHLLPGNPFEPTDQPRTWQAITAAGIEATESDEQKKLVAEARNHIAPIRDLIAACDSNSDRRPLCDARAARNTVEMICAVFDSHRQGGAAVKFPLQGTR